jgi:hypothetical protein
MKNRSNVENYPSAQTTAISEDLDSAFTAVCGVDHHESMVVWRPVGVLGQQRLSFQRPAQRHHDTHRFQVIDLSEQVNVLRLTAYEAMDDHRPAPGQSQGTSFGQREGGSSDAFLKRI